MTGNVKEKSKWHRVTRGRVGGSGSEEAQLASLEAGSTSLLETASAKVLW